MTKNPSARLTREQTNLQIGHRRVAIIGAGFSGLGMAIALRNAGIEDFVILERASDVGGAWRDNTYPGAACDVESALYSYSFAPNPSWTRAFAPQEEIHAYLRDMVKRYQLERHLLTEHELLEAQWDPAAARWEVSTSGGSLTTDVLVSGTGTLSDPSIPDIEGLDEFRGTTFHSAQWRHDVDLTGKRVAVIGTGASAIQFVPAIQPQVGALTVFQRTPTWVIPRHDYRIPATARKAFAAVPLAQRALRLGYYWQREAMVPGLTRNPALVKPVQMLAQRHLTRQVMDPTLRAKLTPDFALGCKRILISNDWYPALTQPNVEVVTDGIARVTATGVVTNAGAEHEVDAIIFGTGFQATEPPVSRRIVGRTGRSLAAVWGGSMRAHKCTTVAEFPNFFIINGPNLGVGHTSMVFMIESQVAYILDALTRMAEEEVAVIEVDPAAEAAFVDQLRDQTRRSVWTTGGCSSWYLDKDGNNTTLWPGQSFSFRDVTRIFDWDNYLITTREASRELEIVR